MPIPVTVLGATGVVGQRFVQRLAGHPLFELRHLAASERSAGQRYGDACTWRIEGPEHAGFGDREVLAAADLAADAGPHTPVVFSALDSGPAKELEPAFAKHGAVVFSNASAFRMEPDVPLLVPEVNPEHLQLLEGQRKARGWSGAILTNPNCTTTVLVMALAPLHRAFGVESCFVASMQAVSGAGYPGVPSLDILGNVVPHIGGEEHKVETEAAKLLGMYREGGVRLADVGVSAMCHRVPVLDGHSEAVSVKLRGTPSPADVAACLREWRGADPAVAGLHSAPPVPIRVHDAIDRPQVRLDVTADAGMSVHVGRIRACPLLGIKFSLLGHNTERGAAGGSMLNAELAHAKGLLG